MSSHDRGTFGELLARAKARGVLSIEFYVRLDAVDDDEWRWCADASIDHFRPGLVMYDGFVGRAYGRTGEEALRTLVEKIESNAEIAHSPESA